MLGACPPSKAISSRIRSTLDTGHELREHAAGRVGVDEGDLEAEEAAPRLAVDQRGAVRRQPLELGADVVDLEGDVVHAGAALGEELPDRCLRAERGEQL